MPVIFSLNFEKTLSIACAKLPAIKFPNKLRGFFEVSPVLRGASLLAAIGFICSAALPSISCCSLAPAEFSETKGYAGEGHKDGKLVHVLAYQNIATNLSTAPGGNAMFLPIPAVPGTMTEQNILDTEKCPNILEDMKTAAYSRPHELTKSAMPLAASAVVFDSGIYTIVLAQDARAIPAALSRVPAQKRPAMNKDIFDAYEKWYPGWTFALCCFNNKDAVDARPMLWWYEPNDKSTLFFPALDAHDGKPPRLGASVPVDHSLMFSTEHLSTSNGGKRVKYSDFANGRPPQSMDGILPTLVKGQFYRGVLPQGDFSVNVAKMDRGSFKVDRVLPPGLANKASGPAAQTEN